jgi:hypothetical protein
LNNNILVKMKKYIPSLLTIISFVALAAVGSFGYTSAAGTPSVSTGGLFYQNTTNGDFYVIKNLTAPVWVNVSQMITTSDTAAFATDNDKIDLQNKINAISDGVTGNETVFAAWDKNASNDFSGAYSSLTGIPTSFTPVAHTHVQANITGLVVALNDKAALVHNHVIADITGLAAALAAKQDALVPGTTIKNINGESLVGSGNIIVTSNITPDTMDRYKIVTRKSSDSLYLSMPTRKFIAGASTNSTRTPAAILQSDIPVVITRRYYFKATIRYASAATTTGAAFGILGNCDVIYCNLIQNNGSANTAQVGAFSGPITLATMFAVTPTSKLTNNVAIIEGEIVANATGFFQIYFNSEVATSAITILTTSRLEYRQIV